AIGLVGGVLFGLVTSAARYAATRGQRDFVSVSQVVARRYDVLSIPTSAQRGRDMLATLAMKAPQAS
ncbi:MAG TPA: magnesium transporter, partial [Umezawaea sp.]|nr:magnesium transporter [Umezawaea sp.]